MSDAIQPKQSMSTVEPTAAWRQDLKDAMVVISMATPLMGHVQHRCTYGFTFDKPTACATVRGKENIVLFNPNFWCNLPNAKQKSFVALHEIYHIFLEHIGRYKKMGYDLKVWNIAADLCINPICAGFYLDSNGRIQQSNRFRKYFEMPENLLFEERFIGVGADEIYRTIMEENNNDPKEVVKKYGGEDGDGNPTPSTSGMRPLDSVEGDEVPSPANVMNNRRIMASAIATAQQQNTIGENEGDLVRTFVDLFKPKVAWNEVIDDMLVSQMRDTSTYNRLSRRTTVDDDIFFPSSKGEHLRVVFGVDSSGSMGETALKRACSELQGIIDQFDSWEVLLLTCDTKAHVIGHFTSEDGGGIDPSLVKIVGGGGTDLSSMVEWANDYHTTEGDVNACILLTDGYIPSLETYFSDDILNAVVITGGGNHKFNSKKARVLFIDGE